MELAIPGIALGLLYVVTNQNKKSENFTNKSNELPNTDFPNRNYPEEYPVTSRETDLTSKLSTVNKFDSGTGVYTDKYFNANSVNNIIVDSYKSENKGASYYSLTGDKVDGSYFQHNNMVPFFGSHIRSRHVNENTNESVLDNYVGAGSQTITKKEVAPLFAPSENQQWAHGAPNMTDFYQSRVNPSMRMANVKPFADEKVAPGLGLGYTTQGADGYNSGMMHRETWMPKTADELRVDNNPKPTGLMLIGHEGPAMSKTPQISNADNIGLQQKYRPERAWEWGQDRLFTTVGAEKGNTLRSIEIDRETARQTSTTDYIGGAGYNNSAEYMPGEYMPSHNQQLGEVPIAIANANGRNYATDADYGIKSKLAYPNNRTANHQESYFGLVSGSLGAAVAPLLDVLRPSRKSNVIGTLRPYQNPGTKVPESYIFNPADRPAPTIRETTEKSKFHMNIDRNQRGGAYEVAAHQPIDNNRQTTGDFYYAGNAGAGAGTRQMKSYEAEYNQRNNDIKSSTIDGRMVPGNMKLMNGDINMRQASRDDYLKNNRAVAGTMPYQSMDVANMGQLQGQNNLYQNIQMDRNNGEALNALKGNPYVLNHVKGL
jgi:hypothetical protein